MIKALEEKRLKLLKKNLDCSSVFQEVESGRWLHVEDVDLAMPHPGTLCYTQTLRLDFFWDLDICRPGSNGRIWTNNI